MNTGTGLHSGFCEEMERILPPGQKEDFFRSLDTDPPTAVRFNPYKLSSAPEGRQVPWCRYGFYTGETRPAFTLDPLHHAGVYYVQEASSMFVEHIVRELFPQPEGLRILDLCAAPGGKTTLLSTLAGLEGLVVANETVSSRASMLVENVGRWGLGNTLVTANDPSHYAGVREYFDLILVDAPCSGEGMFRKNPQSRQQWSPQNVAMCAARQKEILSRIWGSLKPGGILIYSTCTFNRQENEGVVDWLAENYDSESIGVNCPPHWGVTVEKTGSNETYRFYPHLLAGEGFCASILRKGGGRSRTKIGQQRKTLIRDLPGRDAKEAARWIAQPGFMRFATVRDETYGYYAALYGDVVRLSEALNVIYSGVHMGRIIKGTLKPSQSLALFHDLDPEAVPRTEVAHQTALDYLRKKDIPLDQFREGYNMVTYLGYGLGWLKKIGSRGNNLYPKELRITNL